MPSHDPPVPSHDADLLPTRSPDVSSEAASGSTAVNVVLMHGAVADASGWNGVIPSLQQRGLSVIAPPIHSGGWPPIPRASPPCSVRPTPRLRSFGDYLVNADIPDIDVVFVGEPDLLTPLGVKGVGEIGLVGMAAAIANAVHHATGRRIRSLPITIDRLLQSPSSPEERPEEARPACRSER